MLTVAIYIYDGAEVLDFAGPFEVFSTAKRLAHLDWQIILVAETLNPVQARGGFQVLSNYGIEQHPPIDILIVAGGVHTSEVKKQHVINWLKDVAQHADIVSSVCTGAFLLAEAALLDGLTVTTHWEDSADLANNYPMLKVIDNKRWVKQGDIITSAGISAGIDMSLYLISQLVSMTLAKQTVRQMDYDWQVDSNY